jgi:hypothetical protein
MLINVFWDMMPCVAGSFQTFVTIYHTILRHNPEGSHLKLNHGFHLTSISSVSSCFK